MYSTNQSRVHYPPWPEFFLAWTLSSQDSLFRLYSNSLIRPSCLSYFYASAGRHYVFRLSVRACVRPSVRGSGLCSCDNRQIIQRIFTKFGLYIPWDIETTWLDFWVQKVKVQGYAETKYGQNWPFWPCEHDISKSYKGNFTKSSPFVHFKTRMSWLDVGINRSKFKVMLRPNMVEIDLFWLCEWYISKSCKGKFHQIFTICALLDKDELITFWSRQVKGQGHAETENGQK